MSRFDRYMLSQCLFVFGFFSLVLLLVYWINQAVSLFDQLLADGQSMLVFLEFTALTLPNLIRILLPISAFAAVLYVTNRMSSESELTVMQATGYSAKRMARPVLYFGMIAGVLMAVLMHVLVPMSQQQLAERQAEVAQNVSGRLLREGVFTHPGATSTLYLRDISEDGELLDVFLSESDGTQDQIFTAERAFLVDDAGAPRLVLIRGQSQTLNLETGNLFITNFDDLVINIGRLVEPVNNRRPRLRELTTFELINPTEADFDRTGQSPAAYMQELQDRLAQPFFPLVVSVLGFAVLMAAGFSRFGIWRQIILAVALLAVLKSLESVASDAILDDPRNWPWAYGTPILGLAMAWVGLARADRNRRVPAALDSGGAQA
ncbi:MAG: LPS export ABC transporter permease LptF [Pseudomonadota bacterium]